MEPLFVLSKCKVLHLALVYPYAQILDWLERLATGKHANLFRFSVGDAEARFYRIKTRTSFGSEIFVATFSEKNFFVADVERP